VEVVTSEALLDIIYHGREERNLDYKQSMSWTETDTKDKVAKSAIAMANIRDGGAIVFGVRQVGDQFVPEGMDPGHAVSFTQDLVMEYVNSYADPYVELKVGPVVHEGKHFVVIQIRQFDRTPVVCKKNGQGGLRRGAVFSRSYHKHETAQVASHSEMREIVDLAVDNEQRELGRRGLTSCPLAHAPLGSDRAAFEAQLKGL
jgi:predicted HTH transcriptional regulator